MNLIDGSAVAKRVRSEIKAEIERTSVKPGLATVLVGDDVPSHTYVRNKRRSCAEVGIESFHHEFPADTPQEEIENLVRKLNDDPAVHGILVQLPLPKHMNETAVTDLISIEKDVDGFHPTNIGMLALKGREPRFTSCTPQGVMVLLEEAGVNLEGANAVVLGRSNIVGIPVALLLMHANATVTIAHSRTKNLADVCRQADVLIAAVGRAEMVKGDWVKPGAVVIDVGINRVDDASRERGYRLTGDVDFEAVKDIASAITPVPGGVGPMTIAMLLRNTLKSALHTG